MSSSQNGKGSVRRLPAKPGAYQEGHSAIDWKRHEYQLAFDDDHTYVIRSDEAAIFEHWCAANEGLRHYPADFTPHRLTTDALTNLRFREWREEGAK